MPWLRKEEYADGVVEKVVAQTVEELAEKLSHIGLENSTRFVETLRDFNEAVSSFVNLHPKKVWDPAVKDGLSTGSSLKLPKSNWAQTLEQPPFVGVKVATGITFTFGGLSIDPDTAGVISSDSGDPITGLFATGEIVGGLFYSSVLLCPNVLSNDKLFVTGTIQEGVDSPPVRSLEGRRAESQRH